MHNSVLMHMTQKFNLIIQVKSKRLSNISRIDLFERLFFFGPVTTGSVEIHIETSGTPQLYYKQAQVQLSSGIQTKNVEM